MSGHYLTLLNNVIDHYLEPINDIDYITKEERYELVHMYSNENKKLYADKLLITEFENIVKEISE